MDNLLNVFYIPFLLAGLGGRGNGSMHLSPSLSFSLPSLQVAMSKVTPGFSCDVKSKGGWPCDWKTAVEESI